MMLARIAAGAALACLALPAAAADLPTYESPSMFRPTIHDWTGGYLGAHAGWGWGRGNASVGPLSLSERDDNALVGLQSGYQVHLDNNVVVGLEADGTYVGEEIQWTASLRGRLGYAVDNVLVYATAGGAVMGSDLDLPAFGVDQQELHPGWVVGAGIELGSDAGWSTRAEYLYYDFQKEDYRVPALPSGAPAKVDFNAHVVRAGVNYHFY